MGEKWAGAVGLQPEIPKSDRLLAFASPTEPDLEGLLNKVVVVGASKYEQPVREVAAAVSVLTRDEIKTFGWRTLGEALASLPGLYLTQDRQYTYLGARGFGLPGDFNTRMLLAVNGNRQNDTVYDAATVGRDFPIDLELIERIEFIPGPGGAVYGQNAMFGVINVVTREGAGVDGGEATLSWQMPQRAREGRLTWGRVLDNGLDFLVSASGDRSRGEDLFLNFPGAGPGGTDISGLAQGMDGERDREFFARLGRGPWSFELAYGDQRNDDPTAAYGSDPLTPGQYERNEALLAQLRYEGNLGDDHLRLQGRLFYSDQRYAGRFIYSGNLTDSTGVGIWHGLELRLLSTALERHTLMLGLEAQANTRIEQTDDDPTTPGLDNRIADSGHRLGLYAQDEWRFGEDWSATLGLRGDRTPGGDVAWSPRAALLWQALPETTLKALYGQARRAPNAYERDYSDGVSLLDNPALGGERIGTLELVAEQRWGRQFHLRGSLYRWNMKDIITLVDIGGGFSQYQSGADIRADGLELAGEKTWGGGGRLRGSVSWQTVESASGAAVDNTPRRLAKLNYATRLGPLRLGYELQYNSARQAWDGSRVPGHALSNLHLRADRVMKGLDLSLGIYNLFDRRYQHPAAATNWQTALDQDGRAWRARMEYRF
jgi:iron complex outermembrane receptor protein